MPATRLMPVALRCPIVVFVRIGHKNIATHAVSDGGSADAAAEGEGSTAAPPLRGGGVVPLHRSVIKSRAATPDLLESQHRPNSLRASRRRTWRASIGLLSERGPNQPSRSPAYDSQSTRIARTWSLCSTERRTLEGHTANRQCPLSLERRVCSYSAL